jgi:hypothetical protein
VLHLLRVTVRKYKHNLQIFFFKIFFCYVPAAVGASVANYFKDFSDICGIKSQPLGKNL